MDNFDRALLFGEFTDREKVIHNLNSAINSMKATRTYLQAARDASNNYEMRDLHKEIAKLVTQSSTLFQYICIAFQHMELTNEELLWWSSLR